MKKNLTIKLRYCIVKIARVRKYNFIEYFF